MCCPVDSCQLAQGMNNEDCDVNNEDCGLSNARLLTVLFA